MADFRDDNVQDTELSMAAGFSNDGRGPPQSGFRAPLLRAVPGASRTGVGSACRLRRRRSIRKCQRAISSTLSLSRAGPRRVFAGEYLAVAEGADWIQSDIAV